MSCQSLQGVEGGPSHDDGPGLIFHYGQRPILITMVEVSWPNTTQMACVSFSVHNDRRSSCNDCRSLLNTAGVWGGAVSPSVGPGHSTGRGAGAKPREL